MRHRFPRPFLILFLTLAGLGCEPSADPSDGGSDAGTGAGDDAGSESGSDAGTDAGIVTWVSAEVATGSITPQGGTVQLGDLARLIVPAGAVDRTIEVSLERMELRGEHDVRDVYYSLTPSETTFLRPATLRLPVTGAAGTQAVRFARDLSGDFEPLGGSAGPEDTVEVQIVELGRARLGPASDTRTVHGVSVTLHAGANELFAVPDFELANLPSLHVADGMGGFTTRTAVPGRRGTFFFHGVPAGEQLFQVGDRYTVTGATAVDLGVLSPGRHDRTLASTGTRLVLDVDGLTPWTAEDELSLSADNVRYLATYQSGDTTPWGITNFPKLGDTALSAYTVDNRARAYQALVDGARGDRLILSRLTRTTSDAGLSYRHQTQVVEFASVTQVDGQATTVSGTITHSPPTRSVDVDWRRTQFAALATQMSPLAGNVSLTVGVEALVQGTLGPVAPDGQPLLGAWVNSSTTPALPDVRTGPLLYPDPLPGMELRALADLVLPVPYALPQSQPVYVPIRLVRRFPVSALSAGPLVPALGPVLDLRIDTQQALAPSVTLAAPPEVITWSPPAVGTPTFYEVQIRSLSISSGYTSAEKATRFTTDATRLQLPPGIMVPGKSYVVVVTAIVSADGSAAAPRRLSTEFATADAASGVVSVAN